VNGKDEPDNQMALRSRWRRFESCRGRFAFWLDRGNFWFASPAGRHRWQSSAIPHLWHHASMLIVGTRDAARPLLGRPQRPPVGPHVPLKLQSLSGQRINQSGSLGAELLGFDADTTVAVVPAVRPGQGENAGSDGFVARHELTVSRSGPCASTGLILTFVTPPIGRSDSLFLLRSKCGASVRRLSGSGCHPTSIYE
jgi:hypothetical protein